MSTATLTREQVLAMEAGAEMDALVAESVMGWKRHTSGWWGSATKGNAVHHAPIDQWYEVSRPHEPRKSVGPWSPSTDIAAAWTVVEKMSTTTKEHWDISFSSCHCIVKFWYEGGRDLPWKPGEYEADGCGADETPLLICRAALLATLGAEP